MATERLLSLQLSNGFAIDLDATIPDVVEARIESHVCYYASYDGSLSHCNFSLTFWNPETAAPEPTGGLGLCLVLLTALTARGRHGKRSD